MASKTSAFLAELKRRKVYHVAAAYMAVGAVIVFGIPDLTSIFGLPSSTARLVIILVAIGFPIALVLAWAYEVKPEDRGFDEPAATTRFTLKDGTTRTLVFGNVIKGESESFALVKLDNKLEVWKIGKYDYQSLTKPLEKLKKEEEQEAEKAKKKSD